MPTELLQPSSKDKDQGLFFSTPELAQRLDFVRHLTENSDYVPLIKGGAGTGKTQMANRLQSLAGEHWILCRIEASPVLHPNDLVGKCARCFGEKQTEGRLLEYLLHCLEDLRLAGRLAVILVDDAHLLPPETLALLFGLHEQSGGDFPLVRVVLFADPQIDALLATPQLGAVDTQKVHTLQVPRLKAQQIPKFVTYVLGKNGAAVNDALPVDEVVRLYRRSGGIPGRVLELIGQESIRNAGAVVARWRLPLKPAAGLAALILLVSVVLVYQDDINRLLEPQAKVDQELPIPVQGSKPAASPMKEPQRVPEPAAARIRLVKPPAAYALQTDPRPLSSRPDIGPLPEQPAQLSTETVQQTGEQAQNPPKIPESAAKAAAVGDGDQVEPAKAAPQRPAAKQSGTQKPVLVSKTPVRKAPTPPQSAPAKRRSESGRSPPKPRDVGWRREAWLLAQNPEAFTMQLIGVRDEATLGRFIERYGLQDKAVYYGSKSKGKQPWFSLLYGIYPDRKAAEAGRRKLPLPLRKKDVWFRRLDAIQKDIRASVP